LLDWGLGDVKLVTERDEECKWMSAEQIETGEPSKAADVWSLGCVIRCALYGATAPWEGFAPVDAAELIRTGASPRPPKVEGIDVPAPIRTATQAVLDARRRSAQVGRRHLRRCSPSGSTTTTPTRLSASERRRRVHGGAREGETFTPAPSKQRIGARCSRQRRSRTRADAVARQGVALSRHFATAGRGAAQDAAGGLVCRAQLVADRACNALTFIQMDGVIGHGLLYKENNHVERREEAAVSRHARGAAAHARRPRV
jgi:serine/threonine protein kinase